MLEKHCTYCNSSVGYYKRQYLTRSSFYRSLTGESLMFLDPYSIMGGGHLQCTRVGCTWNLSLTVMLWGREVRGWVFWFWQTQNAGSTFTTFRGKGGGYLLFLSLVALFLIIKYRSWDMCRLSSDYIVLQLVAWGSRGWKFPPLDPG